jgi:hypothetical protein
MTDKHSPGHTMRDPIATWDDILDLIAEADAETGTPTEEDRKWSQRLDAKVKARVAELRRRGTPTEVPIQRSMMVPRDALGLDLEAVIAQLESMRQGGDARIQRVAVPPEILALDREAVIAQLESMRQSGDVQVWHRGLTKLDDNELRHALTIAMRLNKR